MTSSSPKSRESDALKLVPLRRNARSQHYIVIDVVFVQKITFDLDTSYIIQTRPDLEVESIGNLNEPGIRPFLQPISRSGSVFL